MARVFDTSGVPLGDQFRVGSGGVGARVVAGRRDGGFQVAWDDMNDGRPLLRVYDAAGNPRASQAELGFVTGIQRTAASPLDDTALLAGFEAGGLWLARFSGLAPTSDRLTFVPGFIPRSADVAYASDGTIMLAWVQRDPQEDTQQVRGHVYDSELHSTTDTFNIVSVDNAQTVRIARRSDGGSMATTWTTPGKVYAAIVKLCAPLNGFCGNGVLEVPCGELCDDGAGNDDAAANACRTDCRPAHCGDGVVDTGEECDDGNNANCDGCSGLCANEIGLGCGDGIPFPLCGESCDDANTVAGDGCSANCTAERALGGGSPAVDCLAEWSIDNPANSPRLDDRGFISAKQRCVDNDPRCDFDGGVVGSCTFHVGVCANNTNVHDCQAASRLAAWELTRPSAGQAARNPAYARDREAFQSVPGVIVGPQIRNICSDFVAVEVPIRGKAGKLKLKSVARSYDAGSDTDSLALTCLASAL
jgi:cysteine-rich repeat protein